MPTVRGWRIVPTKNVNKAFTGEGARRYGGRWNRRGLPAVYASVCPSGAAMEVFVHFDVNSLPQLRVRGHTIVGFRLDIPDYSVVERKDLPSGWDRDPAPNVVRDLGNEWLKSHRAPALFVPSAVVKQDWCLVLNPLHSELVLDREVVEPFSFDSRMFKGFDS